MFESQFKSPLKLFSIFHYDLLKKITVNWYDLHIYNSSANLSVKVLAQKQKTLK